MPRPLSLIAFLPIVEIVLLIAMGAALGFWFTLAWVVGTAFVGVWLLRTAGPRAMQRMQASGAGRESAQLNDAMGVFVHWIAGVLLILPGPLTDIMGIILAVPLLRRLTLGLWLAKNLHAVVTRRQGGGRVYEGETVSRESEGQVIEKITYIKRDEWRD